MIAAENTQEYKTVVNQLLAVLGDPNTRCSEVEESVRPSSDANVNQDREQPYTTFTDDGVAVLVCSDSYSNSTGRWLLHTINSRITLEC